MKKMFFALVAMVMMTMSANAQSENNNKPMTFDRLSRYLELRIDQVEPMKTAMAQFESSMNAYYNLEDKAKGTEAWEKIKAHHMNILKKILTEKQYEKYVMTFEQTVSNTAERMAEGMTASK